MGYRGKVREQEAARHLRAAGRTLQDGRDLDAAIAHWSQLTAVPRAQFGKSYRALADPSIRSSKHTFGCCYVV